MLGGAEGQYRELLVEGRYQATKLCSKSPTILSERRQEFSYTTFQFLHRSEACRRNLQRAPASRHTILAKPSGHSPNSFLLACGICLCKISEPTRCFFGSGVGSLLRDHTMTQLASTACSRPWWWWGGARRPCNLKCCPHPRYLSRLQITKQISGQISDFRFQMPDAVAIT